MAEPRTVGRVLLKMEENNLVLARLATAVEIIGTYGSTEGLGGTAAAAVEVLGEIIGERVARSSSLLAEASDLNRSGAHV